MKEKGLKLHCMDIGLRDKMGVIIINSYTGGGSAPLAVSIITDGSAPLVDLVEHLDAAGSGSFTMGSGGIPNWELSVSATGGSGSYTFTWSLLEIDDFQGVYSVSSTGTTNAATYNTMAITGTIPSANTDPPNDCLYRVSCRVQDGAGGDITVSRDCSLVAIGL